MHAVARARPAFELGLDICAFLFLPVLVLASKGAAPLGAAAGLCALALAAPHGAVAWRRVRGLAVLLGALVLWGAASALWAVEPRHSLTIALRLTGLFAAGLALMAAAPEVAAPERLRASLLAGFALALVLAAVQLWSRGALTAPFGGRGFAAPALDHVEDGFGLLSLPLTAALIRRGRHRAAAVLAAATLAAIGVLVGDVARIGFVLGVAACLLLYRWRVPLARLAAVGSVVLVLAAPLVFPPLAGIAAARDSAKDIKFSAWHRLEIWSFVGSRIAEKPGFGWGLDASRAIPGGAALTPEGRPWLPLHPHNAPLQLWLELGAPGAALLAIIVARLWLAIAAVRWPPLYAAAAGGSLAAGLVIALGSYGVWQEWWIASEFLTLFLILALAPRPAAEP